MNLNLYPTPELNEKNFYFKCIIDLNERIKTVEFLEEKVGEKFL